MKLTTLKSLGLLASAAIGVTAYQPASAQPSHVPGFAHISKTNPVPKQRTAQGCFKSPGSLKKTKIEEKDGNGDALVVTIGVCLDQCAKEKKDVMAVHATDCLCGDTYPPVEDIMDDKKCDSACFGFPKEPCGNYYGYDAWLVYNMGVEMSIDFDKKESKTSTSSAPATSKTSSDTEEEEPATKESSASDSKTSSGSDNSQNEEKEEKGPNVAGIAAGVVVGVVVIAAIIGGGFFFLRRRRNAEIEEEHRRNAAVNAFISGAKPPSSSGGLSMSDSRLEPGLAHRRLSDGSIADNQDYSRKILRVTNA